MTEDAALSSYPAPPAHERLLILGANGPTGRQVVRQALARGHRVSALTRHPEAFPIRHARLEVIAGDATNATVMHRAVAGADAVISVIGASFTRKPVEVYSASAALVVAAMTGHRQGRLIVVTSAGVHPSHQQQGLAQKAAFTLMRRTLGRTVYDDMVRMEATVSATDLDWTIVRPPGLTDEPGRGYRVARDEIQGRFCAREDLARMLLDQLTDTRYHQGIAAVTTPGLAVGALRMFRREVLKR